MISGTEAVSIALWGAGAVLQLAIAVFVYQAGPREPRHVALAAFIGFNGIWDAIEGAGLVASNASITSASLSVTPYASLLTVLALAFFLGLYPRERAWARHRVAGPVGVAVGLALVLAYAYYRWRFVHAADGAAAACVTVCPGVGPSEFALLSAIRFLWFPLLVCGSVFVLVSSARGGRLDSAALLVAASLLIYPIWNLAWVATALRPPNPFAITPSAWSVVVVIAWLWGFASLAAPLVGLGVVAMAWRARGGGRKLALGIALLLLLAGVAGLDRSTGGLASLAFASLLAYAVLRTSLLGVDVKLRWTISKSTIAAAFIAVFFVSSEVAQQFFGDTLGSTYVGIAAAGGLVFAMAPLQRAAERIADKAVPLPTVAPQGGAGGATGARALDAYRAAVRASLRDGGVTRREEIHLAEVAEHLGLSPGEATRVRHEVEDEARAERSAES